MSNNIIKAIYRVNDMEKISFYKLVSKVFYSYINEVGYTIRLNNKKTYFLKILDSNVLKLRINIKTVE